MDKLSFLFFVGNFPDDGERRSPGTHISIGVQGVQTR